MHVSHYSLNSVKLMLSARDDLRLEVSYFIDYPLLLDLSLKIGIVALALFFFGALIVQRRDFSHRSVEIKFCFERILDFLDSSLKLQVGVFQSNETFTSAFSEMSAC